MHREGVQRRCPEKVPREWIMCLAKVPGEGSKRRCLEKVPREGA